MTLSDTHKVVRIFGSTPLVQVDKFEGGDVDEFIEHFEICALANGWEVEKKALMIATCLKGEALGVYKTVNSEGRKDYRIVKETLQMLSGLRIKDSLL